MDPAASSPPGLLVILGPTGVGKSELGLRLAERLDGEIVGCDALQVYRGFDAGTAKPRAEERARVPHHLIDLLDPRVDFTLADFVERAERAIAEIAGRGRVPLVVGGTGMYLRGLLRGVVQAPPRDESLRRRLRGMIERHGAARVHRWLAGLDPESAARVAPADGQRLVRALELALSAGPTWSERLRREGSWQASRERYPSLKIGLDLERQLLARRLDRRVDRFFEGGLIDEVRQLLADGVPPSANAFRAIGYREILAAGSADSAELRAEVQRNTRKLSKRQRTWFRKEPDVIWLDRVRDLDPLVERVTELWRGGEWYTRWPSGAG